MCDSEIIVLSSRLQNPSLTIYEQNVVWENYQNKLPDKNHYILEVTQTDVEDPFNVNNKNIADVLGFESISMPLLLIPHCINIISNLKL